MDTIPSKNRLIEGLQSFNKEVDGVPTVRGMRNEGPYSPHYYKEKFGSWHDALQAAGIQPTHGVDPDVDRETLIEELKKVGGVTNRPPRRTDVDEHGKYPYTLYDEQFESFIHALKAAGIEPDEKQYRFSSVETPEEKRGSENIKKLRNNGPTPSSELPQGRSTKDRQRGVWKFTINSGSTQPADSIYYMHDEHAPELVIRRFFQHNPHVLEYRDAHGIKMEIKNHQPSWKETGREIVDELLEEGLIPQSTFENLVVIRVHEEDKLKYCFDSSVSTLVDIDQLPVAELNHAGSHPVWGFSRDNERLWQKLTEADGLLFSTRPSVFTHYVPVLETLENTDVMTELWVEYENGVRSGGIDKPWPYLVLGKDVQETSIPEEDLTEEIETNLTGESIQRLDNESLNPLLNKYGNFESYIRNHDSSSAPSQPNGDIEDTSSVEDVLNLLFQITPKDIPLSEADIDLDEVNRETRNTAFKEGINEVYRGCAICGDLFESPTGSTDLQAVHILPTDHDGPNLLQNGLGLCSHHHWSFINGWFEIDTDYEIRVREHPKLHGYDELRQYDGAYLHVPTDGSLQPHPYYLQQRNQIHEL
ncbi:homing endonuclease associated repeat-containing protein [Halostagnicola bangensis]